MKNHPSIQDNRRTLRRRETQCKLFAAALVTLIGEIHKEDTQSRRNPSKTFVSNPTRVAKPTGAISKR
ncbi:hypothetical protein [Bradyrhizobium sp. sBnM-33]|uniref:hypothetical protein n=1 Tax=Bradyrhizobium sp. sBnM-33 TaxID=2831780 RepID=UPI00293F02B1|nr:hypothetical protein [Bradyrhizobium sp. sBnM-33]WOH52311.1 hypothetical protein RX328_08865 [Bradyrhizobium sp. sBnM-33]